MQRFSVCNLVNHVEVGKIQTGWPVHVVETFLTLNVFQTWTYSNCSWFSSMSDLTKKFCFLFWTNVLFGFSSSEANYKDIPFSYRIFRYLSCIDSNIFLDTTVSRIWQYLLQRNLFLKSHITFGLDMLPNTVFFYISLWFNAFGQDRDVDRPKTKLFINVPNYHDDRWFCLTSTNTLLLPKNRWIMSFDTVSSVALDERWVLSKLFSCAPRVRYTYLKASKYGRKTTRHGWFVPGCSAAIRPV